MTDAQQHNGSNGGSYTAPVLVVCLLLFFAGGFFYWVYAKHTSDPSEVAAQAPDTPPSLSELIEKQRQASAALYPFGTDLDLSSLKTTDRKRLCGDDYGKIATGWPLQKALVCAGPISRVSHTSAYGTTIEMFQRCANNHCPTFSATNGWVDTWNSL